MAGRTIAMADLDPQAGLTGWYARREAETPVMVQIPPDYDLSPLASAGLDELVIDLPPGKPGYVGRLISSSPGCSRAMSAVT